MRCQRCADYVKKGGYQEHKCFFILAGNVEEARKYCLDNGMTWYPKRMIRAPYRLIGIDGFKLILVGTYKKRHDYREFVEVLVGRKYEVVNG